MRFKEFRLKEQDDLIEIRMDPTSLKKAVDSIDARVGIEFEMVVPGSGSGGDDFESEPDYDYDRRPRNLGDVLDFFNDGDYNSRREIALLERDLTIAYTEDTTEKFYEAWETDGISLIWDWLANNVKPEDIMSILGLEDQGDVITREQLDQAAERVWEIEQEPYYKQARDQAQEEYFEDNDIDSWVRSEYRNMSDISESFTITWPFWTQYDPDEDDSRQMIADEFSEAVGRPVILSDRYHGAARDDKSYVIEPDSSISAGSDELGLEFISPPLPLNEIIKDIEAIKKWAARNGAYTNKSTGLHMNISIPGLNDQNLDYVKLAVLLGDQYVLQQFGREANTYTVSALKQIQDRVKQLDTTAVAKYLDQIKSGLNKRASELLSISGFGKYTSINPKSGYIEFRGPGGNYLDEPTDKLVNTLQRLIVATKSAIDPDADRREYISKLTKLLTPAQQKPTDTIEYFALYSAGGMPKQALKSFIRQAQLQRKVSSGQMGNKKMWWRVGLRSNPNYSIEVVGSNSAEAISAAMDANPELWIYNKNTDFITEPVRPYDSLADTGAANSEAATVPPMQTQYENLLGWDSQMPGANYEVVDLNSYEPVFLFQADSDTAAQNMYERWLDILRHDSEDYGFRQRAQPGSTLDLQHRRARAASPLETYTIYDSQVGYNVAGFQARTLEDAIDQFRRRMIRYSTPERYQLRNIDGQVVYPESSAGSAVVSVEPPTSTTSQSSYPSLNLTAPESNPDANWAIVRNSDDAIIEYFTRNTLAEAETAFNIWLSSLGPDNNIRTYYRLEPVEPRSSASSTRTTDTNDISGWRIILSNGEEVHRGTNTGISQQEAESRAAAWLRNNGYGSTGEGFRVEPIRQGQENTPYVSSQPQSIQWRILVDGEEVHRFWNRNNQGEANAAARTWVLDQIRRGLLSPSEGAEVEVVPVQA